MRLFWLSVVRVHSIMIKTVHVLINLLQFNSIHCCWRLLNYVVIHRATVKVASGGLDNGRFKEGLSEGSICGLKCVRQHHVRE